MADTDEDDFNTANTTDEHATNTANTDRILLTNTANTDRGRWLSQVPLTLPCVLLFLVARYYTDKWQLQTAHNTERVDPAPGVSNPETLHHKP